MKYLLLFAIKVLYTLYYIIRVSLAFIWEFDSAKIDWTAPSLNSGFPESEGWYCKNLTNFWLNIVHRSDDVAKDWHQRHDEYA